MRQETERELRRMRKLCEEFKPEEFSVFTQFSYDVIEREKLTNKEIAFQLNKLGFLDDQGLPKVPNMKFLQKADINGLEMHDLYKFLKRNSGEMFVPRFGMASHIYDYHLKFLCNRYGEVHKFYGPSAELAVIEQDIRELLREQYLEKRYLELIDPKDMFD